MARRPRVLMVSGNAPPVVDGVGDYTLRLLEELRRQRPGWRWLWLAKRRRWFHSPVVFRGGVPLLRPSHSWTARGRAIACATAKAAKPDIIHVQEQIHSFHETAAASELARAAGCRVVTTLHEYHQELPSVVYTDALLRASRVVVANDPRSADRCLIRTHRSADHTWWSGSTVLPPRPEQRPPTRPGLMLTFGFLSAIKSLDLLYQALRLVRCDRPELRWRIIGPFQPETDPLHAALARDLESDRSWVETTGAITHTARLQNLLAEAEVMLLPFADGASTRRTTLQVGWAFGLPVVTTTPREPTDAIVDRENCLLVPEPTPDAWAAAINRVLDDRALAARLRAGSLRTADRFSWERLAARHLEAYDALLASRGLD
jgi:glycosyltransferase involved in cell wall biosynthesis